MAESLARTRLSRTLSALNQNWMSAVCELTMNADRDPVFEALSEFSDSAFALLDDHDFCRLPEQQRTFVCVWSLVGEVDNGGFEQFFYNSSGDYAYETPEALRRIGADAAADIVERSVRLFGPTGPPSVLELRRERMEHFPPDFTASLGQLDAEFYGCPDYDRLDELLLRYIKQ